LHAQKHEYTVGYRGSDSADFVFVYIIYLLCLELNRTAPLRSITAGKPTTSGRRHVNSFQFLSLVLSAFTHNPTELYASFNYRRYW